MGGDGGIASFLTHIDYAVSRFGARHVGIGTDTAYVSANAAAQASKIPKRGPRRVRYESLWPEGSMNQRLPAATSLAWTNWPLFTVGLVQRGYSEEDIRQILGLNMLRITREVLPADEQTLAKQ